MLKTGYERLDGLAGGLLPNCAYLAFGEQGSGKTSFALSYLLQGVQAGEPCALITKSTIPVLLRQARRLGFDLKPFLDNGLLAAFEYQSAAAEASNRLDHDHVSITSEFQNLFSGAPVRRLVIDTLAPFLPAADLPTFRSGVNALVSTFQKLGAACLYLVDTPEGQSFVAPFREAADGILNFSRVAGTADLRLSIERLPGFDATPLQLEFELKADVGFVDRPTAASQNGAVLPSVAPERDVWVDSSLMERFVAARQAPDESQGFVTRGQRDLQTRRAEWKALVIDPAPSRRQLIKDLLHPMCGVLEARGAADGLALVNAEAPDLVILHSGARGATAIEIARKLRQNGKNAPIILIGTQNRRARDHVTALVAGVDVCLSWPLDGRILKLNAYNLLRRWTPALNGVVFPALAADFISPVNAGITCTTDLAYFRRCVEAQAGYAAKFGVSFAVISMQLAADSSSLEELSGAIALTSRPYDITFVGERGVALLLVETYFVEPFLRRFEDRWKGQQPLGIEYYCYTREEDSAARAIEIVIEHVAAASSPAASGPASSGIVPSAEEAPGHTDVRENTLAFAAAGGGSRA